jgi:hypothetical protein
MEVFDTEFHMELYICNSNPINRRIKEDKLKSKR